MHLEGKGVRIVTVNDYLAKRDAEWMGQVHEFLGLTVGVVLNCHGPMTSVSEAYNCDITYVTNNELGFRLSEGQHGYLQGAACTARTPLCNHR